MTSLGGGWTRVVAQLESDRVTNWDEGIQPDYDPSLSSNKGFALNTNELPSHTQMAVSHSNYGSTIIDYFNFNYSTGNIPLQNITRVINGDTFAIHRDSSYFYGHHSPITRPTPYYIGSVGSNWLGWFNTFTIEGNDTHFFAFSPLCGNLDCESWGTDASGFHYNGDRYLASDSGAWIIWVR